MSEPSQPTRTNSSEKKADEKPSKSSLEKNPKTKRRKLTHNVNANNSNLFVTKSRQCENIKFYFQKKEEMY